MLFMEVARLMDHNDPQISTAAHAAMFQLSQIDKDVTKRLGEIPPILYEKGDEFKKTVSEEKKEDKCECSRAWCARVIPLLPRIMYLVFLVLAPVLIAFSLYLMILVLFAFFSSALMSYWFAPLFGVLSGDTLAAVSSILRLVLSAPLMAIFIVYFIRSVNGFLESGIELIKVLAGVAAKYVVFYARHTQKAKRQDAMEARNRHWYKHHTVRFLGLLVVDALLVLLLCFPDVAAFWSVLLLPILIQLAIICFPIYCYWWHIMNCRVPKSEQKLSAFPHFLIWKVKNVEQQEKTDSMRPRALEINSDSSSSSEDERVQIGRAHV
jgi:hypothetical protein